MDRISNYNILEQASEPAARGFREALKYAPVTTVLNKFCNVELALLNKYGAAADEGITIEHPEGLHKYALELEKEFFGASGLKAEDAAITDEAAVRFIKAFSFRGTAEQTVLLYNGEQRECGLYLRQPRGNSVQMRMLLTPGMAVTLQHYYNIYPGEGFLISFALENGVRVSFCPESKDGKKGAGDVYVYAFCGGKIVRAPLTDYVPTAEAVLKLFRG